MKFYFAPLEGITGYIYRSAHNTCFGKADKYFSPFITTNQDDAFKNRDIKDIMPENNKNMVLVPQLLTNNSGGFISAAKKIKQLGYEEINLNLGCPSGTVVAKHKGSGFLALREELDKFLEEIFTDPVMEISIKTRIGKDQPEEFYELLSIYNKYPLKELIIHPRVQKDFYKNKPNREIFKEALTLSKNPICYNGDIFTLKDYQEFTEEFPEVETVMLGRGLLANPGLISLITENKQLKKETLREFHDNLYENYRKILFGDRNILFKMKEIWIYLAALFTEHEKYLKKIKKSERLKDYEEAVNRLFAEQEILAG
ncbi:tRNA dihydrouridine synthase [Anaerocolumna xylanovorans]|uniref:tRNA-dihydrouridine synthase n=1 Tax=Anaerocolumna xylanovorans DSM 12503 TaxID=1121345 RepID=A0A1M7XWU1_9FIRM|nr:tRNA-dihydrouridine synthase family protein [Anaerocolumna xylanovorans]SHO43274.1 tRNA-U20a,U20b-dihydrouridine synthase [Anaerocolumna xylanovorans DSM 12503]